MRTTEEIQQLKKILQLELDSLPEVNALGYSNQNDQERLHGWILDLNHIENYAESGDQTSEIYLWYKDECWNRLCHYDIMLDEFQEYADILQLASAL